MPSVRPPSPAVAAPSVHLRAVFTWLAVYLVIMTTQMLLGPCWPRFHCRFERSW
ncbi:hypothetical protein ACQEU6_02820 [Spirillospora sp. CA-108201]